MVAGFEQLCFFIAEKYTIPNREYPFSYIVTPLLHLLSHMRVMGLPVSQRDSSGNLITVVGVKERTDDPVTVALSHLQQGRVAFGIIAEGRRNPQMGRFKTGITRLFLALFDSNQSQQADTQFPQVYFVPCAMTRKKWI